MKLLRNHLLNYGFILPSRTKIGKEMFERIRKKVYEGGEMINCEHKLHKVHIWNPRDMDKQVVDYAAKLLSKTMADFIRFSFPDDPEMLELADFILMVNNWFDTLNSTRNYDPNLYKYKCAYGSGPHLAEQRQILFDFKHLIKNTQVMNKANEGSDEIKFQPWQKAVLIVCSGFKLLYDYLVDKFRIPYLKTYRANQDTAEQLFSILRSMGGNTPRMDSVNFIYRLERYCIGAGERVKVDKANILFNNRAKTLTVTRNNADLVIEEPTVDGDENPDEVVHEIAKPEVAPEVSTLEKSLGPFEVIFWDDGLDKFLHLGEYKESLKLTTNSQAGTSRTMLPKELEGFADFGGYLSRKHDPSLATKANEPYDKDEFVVSEWINMRNWGSLGAPKVTFTEDLKKMDGIFRKFHENAPGKFFPNDLSRGPNVTKDLGASLIETFPEYPENLLKCFARARTHFRKRWIQEELKFIESFRSKRKKTEYVYAKEEQSSKKKVVKKVAPKGIQKKRVQVKRW